MVRAGRGQQLPEVVCGVLDTPSGTQLLPQPAEVGIVVKNKLAYHHHSITFSFSLACLLAVFKEESPREQGLPRDSHCAVTIVTVEAFVVHPD